MQHSKEEALLADPGGEFKLFFVEEYSLQGIEGSLRKKRGFQWLQPSDLDLKGYKTYHEVIQECRFFMDIDGDPTLPDPRRILAFLNRIGEEGNRVWGGAKVHIFQSEEEKFSAHIYAEGGPVFKSPKDLGIYIKLFIQEEKERDPNFALPGLDWNKYTRSTNLRVPGSPKWKYQIQRDRGILIPIRPFRVGIVREGRWWVQACARRYAQKFARIPGAFA